MATVEEVQLVRRMVDEPGTTTYSNTAIADLLDALGSAEAAAAQVWREKAARLAALTDVSESGSSRSMSKLHTNALRMAEFYEFRAVPVDQGASVATGPFTTPIERA